MPLTTIPETKKMVFQRAIDLFEIMYSGWDVEELVSRDIQRLLADGALKVFAEVYRLGRPVVIETHMEEFTDLSRNKLMYRLHYKLTKVMSRNVVIDVFTFSDHEGKQKWKCAWCGMVNIFEASYCGEKHDHAVGCGVPKGGL